jgi:17beta-estradiol 17-dehydrogenase / very-long-chain 3-oxoacyl-CoA reductase
MSVFTSHLSSYLPGSTTTTILATLGFLSVAGPVYKIIDYVYLLFKPSKLDHYLHPSPDGKPAWALVTGATSGIGKAFSHELASHGFNVVIHGRSQSKLDATETEMRSAHPDREFRQLVADASLVPCMNCLNDQEHGTQHTPAVNFDSIVASLSDLHLTVVISNAGNGPDPTYGTLETYPQSMLTSVVALNALFPLHLLAHIIPTLLKNSPSLVIQIGSLSDNGLPLLSSYASSKSMIITLFNVVAREMRLTNRTGIELIAMRVGTVTGVQHEDTKPSFTMPDAKVFARAALGWVGCGRSEVIPWWGHAFQQAFMVALMPNWVRERVFVKVMKGLWDEQTEREKAR